MGRAKGVPNGPKRVKLDRDGVPVDPEDWTVEDWRTLWEGMKAIKATIAARHRPADQRKEAAHAD